MSRHVDVDVYFIHLVTAVTVWPTYTITSLAISNNTTNSDKTDLGIKNVPTSK